MTDLSDFLENPIVLRRPETHPQFSESHICPECGNIIETTKGPHKLAPTEQLVEDSDREQLEDEYPHRFPTYGYVCSQHPYDVLTPYPVSNSRASGFLEGWAGVPVRFADESIRHIPVPEVELEDGDAEADPHAGGEVEA